MPPRAIPRLLAIAAFVGAFAALDEAARHSFAAHMTQHMVVMVVLAPLLVLGWAPRDPPSWTRGAGVALAAVAAQAAALVVWHIPAVFDAAEAHPPLHVVEHLTLLASATVAWYVILVSPAASATRFVVCAACAAPMVLLGALLTFAPSPWYAASTTHLTDQQVGGAVMWGPAGLSYVVAAAWLVGRAIVEDERLVASHDG